MRRWDAAVRGEDGQAIVLISLFLLAMLMIVGLAVDAGQLYSAKRSEQEAADAAAFAGAVVLYQAGTALQADAAAVNDATRNGFTDGVDGTTVVVNVPPLSGSYVGNANYVEVIITHAVHTALLPGNGAANAVRARGVAGAEKLNNGYAIMALNRGNVPSAFTDASNANISLAGGGILVNSTSATAAVNNQTDWTRFTIGAPYGVTVAGQTPSAWPPAAPVAPNSPQVPDPFAGYPKPSAAGLPVYNSLPAGCSLSPGVYTVPLGGSGITTCTLASGVYVLEAGITSAGNSDMVSAPGGVLLFNTMSTYGTSSYPGGTCGAIQLAGNNTTNLAPMTTGTYAGLLVYQDPACTQGMSISGNGTLTASGSIYVPTGPFTLNGNNATLTGSQLVANTVNVQNGNISISFNGATTAQPILPRLAE